MKTAIMHNIHIQVQDEKFTVKYTAIQIVEVYTVYPKNFYTNGTVICAFTCKTVIWGILYE